MTTNVISNRCQSGMTSSLELDAANGSLGHDRTAERSEVGSLYRPASITGSRPIRRASWRSRSNTRSPASALNPFSKRSTRRPRSTIIGVFGSTPVVEAETR